MPMTERSNNRFRFRPVLGAVLLGYLALLLQPCLAAPMPGMESSGSDCGHSHCADMSHHSNCMVAADDCDSGWLADTGPGPDVKTKLLALPGWAMLAATSPQRPLHDAVCRDSRPIRAGPPLNLRFCVFLK